MKMLVLFGPQGSGNHLFAKIFSLHPDVLGWQESLEDGGYFIPHRYEPFNSYWRDIDSITVDIMQGHEYAVTSISCPYIEDWFPKVPDFVKFKDKLESLGIDVEMVAIGRDRNILSHQQTRVRGGPTWGCMTQVVKNLEDPPAFVSQELLYLYGRDYVRGLGKQLNFPVAWQDPRIANILKEDANSKYIHAADSTWLDDHVKSTNSLVG